MHRNWLQITVDYGDVQLVTEMVEYRLLDSNEEAGSYKEITDSW